MSRSTLTSRRRGVVAAIGALTAVAGFGVAQPAAAEGGDHLVEALQQICDAKGGDFYRTPYTIARCQFTRPSNGQEDGLQAAKMICIMQLGANFSAVESIYHDDGTMTWICYP